MDMFEEFKQNYLTPIRTLGEEEKLSLLQQVVDGQLSLSELQSEATKLKQRSLLKKTFVKLSALGIDVFCHR